MEARLEAHLPPEPEAAAGSARVLVRMPDGARAQRKFPSDAKLTSLIDFVCVQLADGGAASATNRWQLVSQYPPIKIPFDADATPADATVAELDFAAAGLAPSAQLHVSAA